MRIRHIEGATRTIGESQGYLGLPLRDETITCAVNGESTPCMVTAWEPAPDRRPRLQAGAPVLLRVLGTAHPPVMIEVGELPRARRWWPDEYADECMPTGTFSPDDWIIGALGCDWLIGPADRGESRDYGCYILQPGAEIGFTWHEDRGRAELTVFGDGTWRLDRQEPQDWTVVYDRDENESISDSLDDFARAAVALEGLRPDDEPLVYDVGFAKWGHTLFRLEQTAAREARFVPVDADRAEGSGNG